MSVQAIRIVPIKGEMHLKCPECDATRLQVTTNSCVVPVGRYWLTDGDTIPGLESDLIRTGLEKPGPAGDQPEHFRNHDNELLVGNCHNCRAEYFVLKAKLIDDAVAIDKIFFERYFLENMPAEEPTYWTGYLAKMNLRWLVEWHETPSGVALCHTFGPYSLNGSTMKGQYGVSSCSGNSDYWDFARRHLLRMWPMLKSLAVEVNHKERAEAVTAPEV